MDVVDRQRISTSAYLGTMEYTPLWLGHPKGSQNIVAMLSTEDEYVSLSEGVKDTKFVTNLLDEVYFVELPAIIEEDNTGANLLSKNQQFGSRTKHIDVI